MSSTNGAQSSCLATKLAQTITAKAAQTRSCPKRPCPSCVSTLQTTPSPLNTVGEQGPVVVCPTCKMNYSLNIRSCCSFVSSLLFPTPPAPCSLPADHSEGSAQRGSAADGPRRTHRLPAGAVPPGRELHGAPPRPVRPGRLRTPQRHQEGLRHQGGEDELIGHNKSSLNPLKSTAAVGFAPETTNCIVQQRAHCGYANLPPHHLRFCYNEESQTSYE